MFQYDILRRKNLHNNMSGPVNQISRHGNSDSDTLSALDEEIKKKLYLPQLPTVDPLYLFNKMFNENFVPSKEANRRFMLAASKNNPDKRNFMQKFSYICFERGHLASAVLKDEGSILLMAAIDKAIAPIKLKQSRTSELSSDSGGSIGADTVFYDDCAGSARSLALNASKSASKALESLKKAIEQENTTGNAEMKTMEYIIPFVSLKRETTLLSMFQNEITELKGRQKNGPDNNTIIERLRALNNAAAKVQAIINKKRQMSLRFLSLLENAWTRIERFQSELSDIPGLMSRNTINGLPPDESGLKDGNTDEGNGYDDMEP
jgi:hypothetical protein